MKNNFFYFFLKEIRPRQWIKNLAVFAAVVFTGEFFDSSLFFLSLITFFIFCGLSSATYLFNDVIDVSRDRLHPIKKFRPIAAKKISPATGLIIAFVLAFVSLLSAWSFVHFSLFIVCLTYFLLQIAYSLFLKDLPVIDILIVASGYILRVFAGEVATGFHLSVWLMLCVVSLSLFLAIGKRRSELTLLASLNSSLLTKTRKSLSHYSERLLDIYLSMFANSAWLAYALYAFLDPPSAERPKLIKEMFRFSPEVLERKWLMVLTTPLIIFGLMRYAQLIYEKQKGESPERVLLSDKPLLFTVSLWGLIVMFVIYGIGR